MFALTVLVIILGLVVGLPLGVDALSIYYFAALRHSKRLHQMYIATYDERNKQILQATAVATLVLEFLLIFALIAYMPLSVFSCHMLQSYLSCSMA